MRGITRRALLRAGAMGAGVATFPSLRLHAQQPLAAGAFKGAVAGGPASHGLSYFGDLKYGPDFIHFDYVNPDAPKGGQFAYTPAQWGLNQNPTTFNTLNTFALKGDAPPDITVIHDSLMELALDEPDSYYGRLAESVSVEEGGALLRFRLRPEARWHDGTPLTAEDVVFSIILLRDKGHPSLGVRLRQVVSAEVVGPLELTVRLSENRGRDLPLAIAELPIISKAYFANRDIASTGMDVPLGSGPYKIGRLASGRFIEYERVPDYWGKDLPIARGQNNFDILRVEFFRDRDVAFEGFKGGTTRFHQEFLSRAWARNYNFPAISDGRVIRFEEPDGRPSGFQVWYFNTRRQKFKDPRVREALSLAFDFEWVNANIMYGSYTRMASVFENSTLKAEGPPSELELKLLEPLRGKVPDEVFGAPYAPPATNGSGQDRALLRKAQQMLAGAGVKVDGGRAVLPDGTPLTIEFLDDDSSFEPHTLSFIKNLKILGVEANMRVVDPAQFNSRLKDFDYDMVVRRLSFGMTPSDDLWNVFASDYADRVGSSNFAGIKDAAVDALVQAVTRADTREAHTAACRALDRVLRAGRYWIPLWYSGVYRLAIWDIFGRPPQPPPYALGAPATWWWDAAKAERLGIPAPKLSAK